MFTETEKRLAESISLLGSRGIHIDYKVQEGDESGQSANVLSLVTPDAILDNRKTKFVRTPSSVEKLGELLEAVRESKVVLVEGPGGCGKSALVDVLTSSVCDVAGSVTIFMGEQVDSKVLLGTFLCTGTPGEFLWKPGVLAKAVMDGKWVVIEDIDRSPPDVVSLLIPLVKYGTLQLPGYDDPLHTREAFRLIGTRRLMNDGLVQSPSSKLFESLEQKLHIVRFDGLSTHELQQIVEMKFVELSSFTPKLMRLMSSGVNVDSRQFLKVCARIGSMVDQGRIHSVEDAVLECIDVCFGWEANIRKESRAPLIVEIFQNITSQKVQHLCLSHKPVLHLTESALSVGRAYLPSKMAAGDNIRVAGSMKYAHTQSSLSLLEKITRCVQMEEPLLLVGETGVGKTAAISYLAKATGHELVVVNMSQQSDSSDLLGGFKPVDVGHLITPMREKFEFLFRRTFSVKQNTQFLGYVQSSYAKKQWRALLQTMMFSAKEAAKKSSGSALQYQESWNELLTNLKKVYKQLTTGEGSMAFAFVEGTLIKAMNNGHWILLDEINLATPETLQCLSSLLEGPMGTFLLIDRGDSEPVRRHEEFRMFGCMNPATDHGKMPLPPHIRNRMTEFYVEEMTHTEDLRQLVLSYFPGLDIPGDAVEGVIKFYRDVKSLAENKLEDGTGRRPHYSLRTLCRGLLLAGTIHHTNITRALYEGLCMSFISQVTREQHILVQKLCQVSLKVSANALTAPLPRPKGSQCVQVEGYWLQVGQLETRIPEGYILTPSVKENLRNLARIVCGSHFPVLLQGPTSSGKTSLIRWLAEVTGHRCVRINNHEHTDIQEYIGMYTADNTGKLVFKEGVLVEAMREGYWVILDELNLAPTEVLEALNRVLDDNRELFITETQTLVKAHHHFRVFGTQNPPGAYGGRKFLSRAFRNRFIELHFDEIPSAELITILYHTSGVPESYAKKMVAVMQDLQRQRSSAVVFAGKYGLITLRDLFKWARRYARTESESTFNDWEQMLVEDGYLILAGRARHSEDERVIVEALKSHFKKTVNPSCLFGWSGEQKSLTSESVLANVAVSHDGEFGHVVWTDEMKRMAVLVGRAVQFKEPVLLVGETGCGKTTMCQLLCSAMHQKLHCINCHMYTEASDFLGGLRAARRTRGEDETVKDDKNKLFEWYDGVLVQAMQEGTGLLIDEISLAEDAVLERLNSVLEEDRKVLVAERGTELGGAYEVVAHKDFVLFATMNPGGDYGKRELSPALRNRFTEIWCPSSTTSVGMTLIARHNLPQEVLTSGVRWELMMTEFIEWLQQRRKAFKFVVSTRDLMAWIHFFSRTVSQSTLTCSQALYHGACLVFLDSLPTDTHRHKALHKSAVDKLQEMISRGSLEEVNNSEVDSDSQTFGIHPFFIPKDSEVVDQSIPYTLDPPGPRSNAFRLLRALQISKPLLLEGPPGVGKTTLVAALARASGYKVTRICLSEQTDLTELFGSDLPDEDSSGVKFSWRDGPFLRALRGGHWIVLDEMNLASQAILEGLNACLDHRCQVFIPALDLTFSVSKDTRIFACQNPVVQGGGRKQLPKSFVNRFTKVYMEKLSSKDLLLIACSLYPDIERGIIRKMIKFNKKMSVVVDREKSWEFNLRDILRWCQLMVTHQSCDQWDPGQFLGVVYIHRLRKEHMIKKTLELYGDHFPVDQFPPPHVPGPAHFHFGPLGLSVGRAFLPIEHFGHYFNLFRNALQWRTSQLPYMEAMLTCMEMNWMAILVGDANSGKSSIVHVLAQLTGHKVVEFPVNSSMDTTDLVGGYVQMNASRHIINMAARAKDIVLECVMASIKRIGCCEVDVEGLGQTQATLSQLCSVFHEVGKIQEKVLGSDSDSSSLDTMSSCVAHLKEQMSSLISIVSAHTSATEAPVDVRISDLERSLQDWTGESTAQFEWVDSTLVTALKEGHWLVISNANFCSPSVLDRLNALLEPGGVLTVDERGTIDGDIPVIKPHPDFRLFMTMDPKYGELSKAMRNRGIEVYIHRGQELGTEPQLSSPELTSSEEITRSLDSWVVSPSVAQVRHHMLPLLRTLVGTSDATVKKLSCQMDAFCNVCQWSDVSLREELLMLLGNEVNPSIKPVVVDSLNYLQSMKALMSNSTVEEDVKYFLDIVDVRCLPFLPSSSKHRPLERELLNKHYSQVVLWKLSSKVAQVLEMLKRLSSSQTGRALSLLQLSRAVSTGAVSSAVLGHRDIAHLYTVLECALNLLRSLCEQEGCHQPGSELGEQFALFCSWVDVVMDVVTAVDGSWLSLSVCWELFWRDFVKLVSLFLEEDGYKNMTLWKISEEFAHNIHHSLEGPSLWLLLWSTSEYCKLHITQQTANIWRSTRALVNRLQQAPTFPVSRCFLTSELSTLHSGGVELLKKVWKLSTCGDSSLTVGMVEEVERLSDSLTAYQPSCGESTHSQDCPEQGYSMLVCCNVMLALRRINLAMLDNDITQAVEQSCVLNEYLKSISFPLTLKASLGILADLKVQQVQDEDVRLVRDLLCEAKSKVSSLAVHSITQQQQQQIASAQYSQQPPQVQTVSQEIMSVLFSPVHTGEHSGTFPSSSTAAETLPIASTQSGTFPRGCPHPLPVTISSAEAVFTRLSLLHAQLWESAFNGSVCPRLHCSLEYEVQLRQYQKTVGVVFNTAKKLGSNPPSENYLVALNNLSTQPSQLRTVFDCTTSVGTALDLLDQSCVRLQALQALEDKLNVNMEAQVNDQTLFDIGAVSVCNGLALACLLSPQLDFNPFNVTRTEHKILNDLLSALELRFSAFQDHYSNISSSLPVADTSSSSLDHWLPQCMKDIGKNINFVTVALSNQNFKELSQVDPGQEGKFQTLSRQSKDLMSTLCSKKKVLAMVVGLEAGEPAVLSEARGWMSSVLSALSSLDSEFVEFCDLLLPWKLGLLQVAEGILMLCLHGSSRRTAKGPLLTLVTTLQPDWGNPLQSHTKGLMSTLLNLTKSTQLGHLKKSLMLSGIKRLSMHVSLLGILPKDWQSLVRSVAGRTAGLWREAEDVKRKKEEEESALFWYKEKSHSFTEEDNVTFVEKLFPDFEFELETAEDNESRSVEMDMETGHLGPTAESGFTTDAGIKSALFTPQEMASVFTAMSQITGVDGSTADVMGLRGSQEGSPSNALYQCVLEECRKRDYLQPILPFLSKCDQPLMSAHLKEVVAFSRLHFGVEKEGELRKGSKVNVYHDPLPQEFRAAKDVLHNLSSACVKFLMEWPEHPVLNKIVASCRVVLSLPATSPLMKVLAGLEYVLRQTQEWEMYASSQVSLRCEMESLTGLILKWRKLELSCWEELMEMEERESCRSASKWWFHVHETLAGLGGERPALEDALQVLQSFVESSSIGEFAMRVNILRVSASSAFAHPPLSTVLNNMTHFYGQFIEPVKAHKDRLREPLEKEFKDHVSLLRWNDGNYWALKDAIKRNHAAVANLIRKYKEVLMLPVRSLLTASSLPKLSGGAEGFSPSFTWQPLSCSLEISTCPAHLPLLSVEVGVGGSISVHTAHQQLRKHCKEMLSDPTLQEAIHYVQDSLADISSQMKEIGNPVNLTDVAEDKRKSEGKLQLQLKKRSLTDLFKFLASSGFSYKKGSREVGSFVTGFVHTPALVASTLSSCFDRSLVELVTTSSNVFYRVVAMVINLNKALLKPSKELSFGEVSRVEGLTGSFVALLSKQRSVLSLSVEQLDYLTLVQQTLQSGLGELRGGLENTTPFIGTRTYQALSEEMESVLEQCVEVVEEVRALKGVHPGQMTGKHMLQSDGEYPRCLTEDGRIVLKESFRKLEDLVPDVQSALKRIDSNLTEDGIFPFTCMVDETKQFCDLVSLIRKELEEMISLLCTPTPPCLGPFACFTVFLRMSSEVLQQMERLAEEEPDSISNYDVEMGTTVVDIVKAILLGVQALIKAHHEMKSATKQPDSESEGVSSDDSVFFKMIFHTTVDMVASLQGDKVTSAVRSLASMLSTASEKFSLPSHFVWVLTSFLECYNAMLGAVIHLLLSAHHATELYLQELLEMFSTIVEKGFGIPDLDPTAEDVEGSTEFTDVEGGGFDEGEGAQNVSKGNEDLKEQLENANKSSEQDAEKEEQKSGEDGDDDGIEMDFDFDGQIEDVGKDDEENPNNSEGEETEEISEKMGDLGNDPGDVLDKNIWDPKDDEDKTEDLQELPDASVEGTDTRDDPEVVAKDKNELVSDEQNDKPPSPKEGEIDPLPDDWEMKEDGIDPSDDGDDDKPGAEHDVNEREIEGSDSQSINEEENGEDKEGVEKVTDENNEPAEDGDDTLEEKLSSEMSQPGEDSNGQDKENDDIHPPEDQLGTDVPEDQVSYQQSMPNTSSVQSDSTMSTSLQGSFDPNQEQSSAEQSHFGRETVSPRETSSEDVGKQKVPKSSRSSPPSRTPVPRESLPSAKRVKLSKEHSNAQSEEKDQKQESSLYSHVEDESVWDEQALDSAVLGQEGTQPVLEDIEDDNDESDAVEEMDVEDTERERMAEESIKRVAAKEMPVPSEEEQKGDLSEGGEENSDTESDGDEMEMETDSRELSFYHFSTDHYQDTSRTAQQDSEAVLKMVEESTLLLQNEDESTVDSTELWSKYEMLTSELSQSLYESIRITFEPTLATQFKGDFRSGKRLNIRRLIPYIASHYQNDRIWLRRSKPSKMNYQVLVAVDDSSSMAENKCRLTAFKSLAAISGALGRLEGVSFGICRFGNSVDVLKRFGEYMTTEGGGFVLKNMTFQQKRTNFVKLLKHSTAILSEEQRLSLHQSRGGRNQLLIVLSDGRGVFMDGAQAIEKAVRELNEEGIFSVFIILDPLQKDSVLSIRIPVFRQGEVPSFKSYLEAFPFPYYIILKDIESLPSVLGESLQQWFQLVNEATK